MKTITVLGQAVVGKNAPVVVKVADFDADYTLMFNTILADIRAGLTVGIVARNPVNKKEHIAEAMTIVSSLNTKSAEGAVEEMEVRTLEVVVQEIAEVQESLDRLDADYTAGKVKHEAKINMFNKLDKELVLLRKEEGGLRASIARVVKPVEEMTLEERTEHATLLRWKDRQVAGDPTNISGIVDYTKATKNQAFKTVGDSYDAVKNVVLSNRPTFSVIVHQIVPFAQRDRNDRVGYIIFQVPAGMLQVKQWDGQSFVWLNIDDYDYNAFNSSRARLTHGSGFLKLAIKENAEGLFVSWPKSKGRDDQFYDVFMARDARFDFFNSDNNYNVQASLTAFVRTFWGELKVADPRNRQGFNEHCGNCRHMTYMAIHDQMGDDYENKANPVDTSELGQWGAQIPQWVCSIHGDFTDGDAIDNLNESTSFEVRSYTDNEGVLRFLRAGEVLIKGKPVHTYTVRAEGTTERCATCPFYTKSERKPDKRYGKEVEQAVAKFVQDGGMVYRKEDGSLDMKAMKLFVPRYWTDRAQAERMPVFTKHAVGNSTQWDLGFPGEFTDVTEFMIQGLGGVNIYGTAEIMEHMPRSFVPTTEAYRTEEAQLGKLINYVYNVCFNFTTIQPDTLDALVEMINNTPAPTRGPLQYRYERAMQLLVQTIQENQ